MEITLREARKEDFGEIFGLLKNEMGYGYLNEDSVIMKLKKIIGRADYKTLVAVSEENVVGVIGFCRMLAFEYDKDYIQIILLTAKEEHQNKGVGTRLIDAAEKYARNEGLDMLGVTSGLPRINAHRFYENRGFEKNGYRFKKLL